MAVCQGSRQARRKRALDRTKATAKGVAFFPTLPALAPRRGSATSYGSGVLLISAAFILHKVVTGCITVIVDMYASFRKLSEAVKIKKAVSAIHCFPAFPYVALNLILDFLRRVRYTVRATCLWVHVTAVRPRAESRLLPARCHRQKKHRLHCVGGVFFYAVVPNDTKHYSFSIIRSVTAGVPQ